MSQVDVFFFFFFTGCWNHKEKLASILWYSFQIIQTSGRSWSLIHCIRHRQDMTCLRFCQPSGDESRKQHQEMTKISPLQVTFVGYGITIQAMWLSLEVMHCGHT